jgi:hypothetical protein
LLDLVSLFRVNVRRADMLRSAARLRIEKRVLVIEIVEAALGNYFDNGQSLVTEDTYR